ncbi:MAG: hypothetical protein K2P09_03740 [Erysipelotrichales bacterium]|nr:hypothetical protein [Erysipelotrichales bacterium]
MYIIDHLIDLHNHYTSETTQYILSEYFLLHLKKLNRLKLNEVAKQTHISSSSITRFCKSNGYETFSSFIDLLYLDVRKVINQFDYTFMNRRKININPEIQDKLIDLVKDLKQSQRVILYGSPKYCSLFNQLIKYLFIQGINVIECKTWSIEQREMNFDKMDNEDTIIIVDPSYNIKIFLEETETSIGGITHIRTAKGKKYFIGDGEQDFLDIKAIKLYQDNEYEYYKSCYDYIVFILYMLMED